MLTFERHEDARLRKERQDKEERRRKSSLTSLTSAAKAAKHMLRAHNALKAEASRRSLGGKEQVQILFADPVSSNSRDSECDERG